MARVGATLSLLILLAACATVSQHRPADPNAAWARRQSLLDNQQKWALNGKLAVVANQEGWYAGLRWQQNGPHFQIDLLDSFGRVVVRIKSGAAGVALIQRDGSTTTAPDAESLMQKLYGWALPVSGLRYWVLGIPGPGRASGTPAGRERIDDYGRLAELNQAGWAVDYKRYQSTDLIDLPEEIMVFGHELRVKLIVSEWDLIGT